MHGGGKPRCREGDLPGGPDAGANTSTSRPSRTQTGMGVPSGRTSTEAGALAVEKARVEKLGLLMARKRILEAELELVKGELKGGEASCKRSFVDIVSHKVVDG